MWLGADSESDNTLRALDTGSNVECLIQEMGKSLANCRFLDTVFYKVTQPFLKYDIRARKLKEKN